MRMRAGVLLLLAVGFLMAAATKNPYFSQRIKHRPRPREIRGYEPDVLSTAIGFGKRGDPPKSQRYDKIFSILLQKSARGNPGEGSSVNNKLRSNPIMMGKLIQLLLDVEQNETPTMIAVPQSERIMSLI